MGRRYLWSAMLVAAASAATTAFAADLPVAPVKAYAPPPPAHYNWSGIYFGGHVGAGLLQDRYTFPTTTVMSGGAGTLAAGTTTNVSPYAVIGGAQVGANLQFGPAVVGVEGTWTSSAISGNYTAPLTGVPAPGQEQSRSAPHWYATATGKLGFAANDWLFYAKGGGAWMRVDYTQSVLAAGGTLVAGPLTLATDRSGWTVGVGVEYALNENLSAKLEYDFLDFGTKSYTFPPPALAATALPVSIQSQTHMFLFGMNYRFYFGGY